MVSKPCCIDIYHGDEVSDNPTSLAGLDRVKAAGIFACIHKASEGVNERDSRYDARRAKWMHGGSISTVDTDGTKLVLPPLWGAYHFFHGVDPQGEARNFLMTARLQVGDMAFIDWEAVGASGFQPSLEAADAFCRAVEAATGRPCGVYGGNVPRERFEADKPSDAVLERFAARPLWFCAYGSYSAEKIGELTPVPWREKGIWLWQDDGDRYGPGPHSIPGVSGYCDNSTVVGDMTLARLHNEWIGQQTDLPKIVAVVAARQEQPAPPKAPVPPIKKSIFEELREEVHKMEQKIEEELHRDDQSLQS